MNPDLEFHELVKAYLWDREARGMMRLSLLMIEAFGISDEDLTREFFGGDE